MTGLTARQSECLDILVELNDRGISPSYDELRERMKLASKGGITRIIDGLEERGFVRRLRHRARAIEVVKRPKAQRPAPLKPPTPGELTNFGTPELLDLLAHVCGILAFRLGPAMLRETLGRISTRLAGSR